MNNTDKYILLDNVEYFDFFLNRLRNDYIPIVLDVRLKPLLEARGIKHIGIIDHISIHNLKGIAKESFVAAQSLLKELDKENKEAYFKIFGTPKIKFMTATIRYLFIRFTIGTLQLLRGLEAILKKHKVKELAYLHDGNPKMLCGTKKERGFLFPDTVTWDILKSWKCKHKPELLFVKGYRSKHTHKVTSKNLKRRYLDQVLKLKTHLSPIKKALLSKARKEEDYSGDKKALVFIGPLYDSVLHLDSLSALFNIIRWDADGEHLPLEIKNIPNIPGSYWRDLTFNAKGFESGTFFDCLDYKSLSINFIRQYCKLKLPDVLRYWRQAEAVYEKYKPGVAIWNNTPHRYPIGIVREFFRLKNVPICGMQHGGKTGSNDINMRIINTELIDCDYFFSYGFREADINLKRGEVAKIIPTGSSAMHSFYSRYQESEGTREKVDIIFPIQISNEPFFSRSETLNPRIFEFQKKIIDLLAKNDNKKILLKFSFGQYENSALGMYIENKYSGKFLIVDHMPFTKCLERYSADTILIEEQSTPLNESIITENNIVAYNNPEWCGLTNSAFKLLSKRAIICNTEESFLEKVKCSLDSSLEKKDIKNREFWQKYCVYDGVPELNVRDILLSLVDKTHKEEIVLHAS